MARKHLIRGENATRVIDRIARAPEDLGQGSGIFSAIRGAASGAPETGSAEDAPASPARDSGKTTAAPSEARGKAAAGKTKSAAGPKRRAGSGPKKTGAAPKTSAGSAAKPAAKPTTPAGRHDAPASERVPFPVGREDAERPVARESAPAAPSSEGHRHEISFTRREREVISRSCKAYRNSLPFYLKSVREEVDAIDSVLRKIED